MKLPVFAMMIGVSLSSCLAATASEPAGRDARELRVPGRFATIQSAIDSARSGDTVLVGAGTYRERLKLKAGIIVKSEGDDAKGKLGLKRAEATILDGTGGDGAGVDMAPDAVLDGFTVTGVGKYDDALWQHDFDTHGNEQLHEHIGQAGTPGIAVNHDCTVANNIVHHVGYTGIAITGAAGRKVSPRITGNVCYRNMGGGIGSMNGSTALIENNLCFENLHAGIGHDGAGGIVRANVCHGNIRAGIGISEGASPAVTGNRCYNNRRAGIGIRTGKETRPVVQDNECIENDMAGIGVEEGARPLLSKNRIIGNKLVAIGVTGGSEATIKDNELAREGGVPPMIAVLDGSRAIITGNTIRGGGVAGILVKGGAEISGNHFIGTAPRAKGATNAAAWAQPGSNIAFNGNNIEHWPHALLARNAARVVAKDNETSWFTGAAIVVKDSKEPAEVSGNVAISEDPDVQPVDVTGPSLKMTGNELRRPATKP
jgi:hypothetical protein